MNHDSKEDFSKILQANSGQRHEKSRESTTKINTKCNEYTRHLPGYSDDAKTCGSGIHEKKSDCCISVREKIIIKRKLNQTDKLSDFTLVDGSIYIRKSAVDTGATNQAATNPETTNQEAPQSGLPEQPELSGIAELPVLTELTHVHEDVEPESKGVQVPNIKDCMLCCKHLKCGLTELLHLCDSDPDAIIRQYEHRISHCGMQEEGADDEFVFQMDKTHGSVFGDAKYHYLMVDKSTLLNEEIPKTEEKQVLQSVPTDISISSKVRKSARLLVEKPSVEEKSEFPIFLNALLPPVEGTETPENNATAEVTPSDIVFKDPQMEEDHNIYSNATLILKHPSHDDLRGTVSTLEEMHGYRTTSEHSKTDESHRVSVIWDGIIDPETKMVRAPSNEKERRVSAVSWSGIEENRLATITRKSIMKPVQKEQTKISIFEDIVRAERSKTNEATGSRSRGKSLIDRRESSIQKKKWFGQKNKRTDSGSLDETMRQRSVIASVIQDVEETDSAYLIKDTTKEEMNGAIGSSHRNSLEAYRRRSVTVEHPVFEKRREINQYLNNV